ncbi:unnamed protein product [Meloidogyne enterolobii]|uniref:Uncharacterized protein n=1 Tax=Meloidogyne enterolobii TaxID=390850 RepID=A0ACB1AZQ0_MELEN
MPLIAPPPKPGRIRVYRVIDNFLQDEYNPLSLTIDDIVYLRETKGDAFELKCPQKGSSLSELYKKEIVETKLELIEFPLHEAAKMGDCNFLRECLENKVSVNSLDRSSSTALHWAAYTGHFDILEILLTISNVAISAQNKLGDTPLHAASSKGRIECVQLLVDSGANLQIKNSQGKRPIDVAINPEIASFLQTTMSERGLTELEAADYLGDEEDEESIGD